MEIRKLFWNIISAGRSRESDIEVLRRILVLNALMMPGMVCTLLFGILAFLSGNNILGIIDMLLLVVQLWLLFYTRRTDDLDKPVTFAVIVLLAFLLFITVNGGIEGTSVVWLFLYPYTAIFLTGARRGTRYSLILLALVLAVFALQHMPFIRGTYTAALQARFFGVYITIMLLSISAEELHRRIKRNLRRSNKEKEKAISELNKSLDEIKTLQGILPICLKCKKIRNDDGYWQAVEEYVQHHTDAKFSHALCPDCVKSVYPEYTDKDE